MKNIVLLTGGKGFIGNAVKTALMLDPRVNNIISISRYGRNSFPESYEEADYILKNNRYYEVIADIRQYRILKKYCDYFNPNIIIHLAANPITKYNANNPFELNAVNITGTQNLLEAAPQGCRFVYASSASVYGNLGLIEYCRENHITKPTNIYGVSKLAGEGLVRAYTTLGKVKGVSLRYVAQVGRGSTHGVFHDIMKTVNSKKETLELFGDRPGTKRPYMHIEDTASATVHAAFYELYSEVYNVAPYYSLSTLELASCILENTRDMDIKWLGEQYLWAGDNPVVKVDGGQLKCSWQPKYKTSKEAVAAAAKECYEN